MSWALYRNVLRLGRMGALSWALTLMVWASLVIWIFPTINEAGAMEDYVNAMPEAVQAAIGVSTPEDMAMIFRDGGFTLAGYVNTEYLTWLPLLLGVYAVVYCGGLVSKEAERGTLDTLLSQPLKRSSFLLSKFAGFATLVIAAMLLSFLSILIGSSFIDGEIDVLNLVAIHGVGVLLVLAIAGYSTLASCLFLDPGKSLAVAGLATALSFFANIAGLGVSGLGWVKNLSLFHYYDSLQVIAAGNVNWTGVVVYAAVLAGTLTASWAIFRRKDLAG
jgi:ABC-2 type transport system permease protein